MKYIHLIVIVLAFAFCSCSNNNDNPFNEKNLPIIEAYVPVTVAIDINDSEWKDKILGYADKQFVVNSLSELPDDPFGFLDAYRNINFNERTLLITYNVHNWTIDTYRNRYYIDMEGAYNWSIGVRTATKPGDSTDQWYFTRYAIMVNKLPQDNEVRFWFSLGSLNRE